MLWPLAAFAVLATRWAIDVPTAIALLLVLMAAGFGVWRARTIRRAPHSTLELWPEEKARWVREGRGVVEGPARAHEQWPVTTVRFLACGTTVAFWPDTLCASGRRALRRWARSADVASPLPQFWMG